MDSRGYVAALALGANGAPMRTRFVATHQSIAHPRYKEALLAAIDTGTIIAGRYHRPTRLLRRDAALKIKDSAPSVEKDASEHWESELGPAQVRAALLDGGSRQCGCLLWGWCRADLRHNGGRGSGYKAWLKAPKKSWQLYDKKVLQTRFSHPI